MIKLAEKEKIVNYILQKGEGKGLGAVAHVPLPLPDDASLGFGGASG